MLKNSFINNIYCEELDTDVKGFLTAKQLKILKEHSTEGYVLQGMEFRPDKVAAYYLGDERLGWAISAASGFINGIQDYREGIKVLIPTQEAFVLLGE
jgi:hypothetical protein